MLFVAVNAQAGLKNFVSEYLGQSNEIKNTRYLWDNQKLLLELEQVQRPWTTTYAGEMEDSSLKKNPFSLTPANQKTKSHTLALAKEFIWGGELSLSGTLYDFESSSNYKSYSQTLTYSQDLGANLFGRNEFLSLDVAKETETYQRINFDSMKSAKLLSFIASYIDYKKSVTHVDLQEKALKRSLKRLNLVKRQVRDGLKEKVDLYSSQTSYQFQQERLSEIKSALAVSRSSFASKLERDVLEKEIEKYNLAKEKLPSLPEGEVDKNLSVKALNQKLSYLKKEVESADNSIFPTISLEGTYSTNNFTTNDDNPFSDGTFGSNNDSNAVALTVSIPLGFDVQKNTKKIANLAHMQAQYEKRVAQVQVKNNVEKVTKQLELLDKNINSVISRYSLAKKTVDEYNKLYNRGRANLDQVIRAEEDLINTEVSFVQYKVQREKLYYTLLDLYGQLNEVVSKL